MFDPPYALWSIWKELSFLQQFFTLTLSAVSLYTVVQAILTIVQLRSMRTLRPAENNMAIRTSIAAHRKVWNNVRQLIRAAFLLFRFILFLGLQYVGKTLGDGPTLLGTEVLGNFIMSFAFAANVFFVFLVLHLVQWFVYCRLGSCEGLLIDHRSA